ncbi:MAG: hypothetical protein A2V21_306280 [Deltaproteobacteria bacterium GWC2_55_46]|nr:MAG: hypothetical protein A2Z79_00375 [Deltaproteobacteria bacterium GWA2_55_82]OGQ64839.1 MAG: hypothetical protein A3I81_04475 [Deltaproteobacteria bacterium RIFCSPLOWO2_02_FULL_55_12]OIJ73906.1 MAG: hypothetical protein A2V21_306280 [Deltaproteobacteria bacterium GWC2_55_46]
MKNVTDTRLLQRAFNLRFGLKLCLFTLLGGGALVTLLWLSLARSVGDSYGEAIYSIYDLKLKVLPLIFASSYSILILALVTAAVAVISVLYSHRIAGPIFRLERNIEIIASGDLAIVTRFRSNDQLSVLADDLNSMVRSINHTTRSVKDALDRLGAAEDTLRELGKGEPDEKELRAAIEGAREGISELKKALSHIKMKEESA